MAKSHHRSSRRGACRRRLQQQQHARTQRHGRRFARGRGDRARSTATAPPATAGSSSRRSACAMSPIRRWFRPTRRAATSPSTETPMPARRRRQRRGVAPSDYGRHDVRLGRRRRRLQVLRQLDGNPIKENADTYLHRHGAPPRRHEPATCAGIRPDVSLSINHGAPAPEEPLDRDRARHLPGRADQVRRARGSGRSASICSRSATTARTTRPTATPPSSSKSRRDMNPRRLGRAVASGAGAGVIRVPQVGAVDCTPPPRWLSRRPAAPASTARSVPTCSSRCCQLPQPDGASNRTVPFITYQQIDPGTEARDDLQRGPRALSRCRPATRPEPLTDGERQTLLVWYACGALDDSPAADAGAAGSPRAVHGIPRDPVDL